MKDDKKELFEFFSVETEKVRKVTGKGGKYEGALKKFVNSGKEQMGVRYHGQSEKLSGVVATLRKIASNEKYAVDVSLAETERGEQVILFTRKGK